MDAFKFQTCRALDEHSFGQMFEIYAEAIPHHGQKPRDAVRTMVARSDYVVTLATHGGQIVGFAVAFMPTGQDYALLEYMAVHAQQRGKGVGGGLLTKLVDEIARDAGRWILVEVDASKSEEDRRRKDFYSRFGWQQVEGLRYLLPLPDVRANHAMHLMARRPEAAAAGTPVDARRLRRWLTSIYVNVYGCASNDARIGQMMADVPA